MQKQTSVSVNAQNSPYLDAAQQQQQTLHQQQMHLHQQHLHQQQQQQQQQVQQVQSQQQVNGLFQLTTRVLCIEFFLLNLIIFVFK